MGAYKSIRALSRAIVVLEHLNRVGESSSNAIAIAVGLPKTTSYRMLKSLMECDLAYYSPSQNRFRLTPRMEQLGPRNLPQPCVEQVIHPALLDLSMHILWPCAFSTCEFGEIGEMVVQARTHQASPFAIPSDLHLRRDLTSTAAGLAYLAHASPHKRAQLLAHLNLTDGDARLGDLEDKLDLVRSRGFAIEREVKGETLGTLAIPLYDGSEAIGSLHMTWLPSEHDTDQVTIERILPELAATRKLIESNLRHSSERSNGGSAHLGGRKIASLVECQAESRP